MKLQNIFERNKEWVAQKIGEDADYFNKLASGQNPDILYIGCCDSRVTAEEIMGVGPGDVFVHRNVANLVVHDDQSAAAAINFSVNVLHVKHIVICGHTGCGGVQAALNQEDTGVLEPWIKNIRPVIQKKKAVLADFENNAERANKLAEFNVQAQVENVMKIDSVAKAMNERGLKIHGWIFELKTGLLKDLKV